MAELVRNAWAGWRSFAGAGKLPAALLISLLFLWIYYKRVKQKGLLIYTTAAVICCILPVTAALLELYQTRFYDYKWIWSLVPMTAVTGLAITLFLTDFLQEFSRGSRKRQATAAALLAAGLVLCGGMGSKPWEGCGRQAEVQERQKAEEILEELQERLQEKQICLWAPRELLEYARAYDASILLLYGRDMWDTDLTAYSYEAYPGGFRDLYLWMEAAPGTETVPASYCAQTLAASEVNCILLPGDKPAETIQDFEDMLGVQAETLDEYYLMIR